MKIKDYLTGYAARRGVSFHTPGHKDTLNGRDTTEFDCGSYGNISDALKEAEQKAASAYGAKAARYSLNGSTGGVLAMLTALPRGSRVIIARSSHKSVFFGCALGGLEPVVVDNEVVNGMCLPLTAEEIGRELQANPDTAAVFVTSPDYYGNVTDLAAVRAVVGNRLLLVDAAHGAHFGAHAALPASPAAIADACVLGAHKTLKTLTQGAVLVWSNRTFGESLERAFNMLSTTSPSYLIAESIESGIHGYRHDGEKYGRLIACIEELFPDRVSNDDPTRLVFDCAARGMTGYDAERQLAAYKIDCEFANDRYLVLIVTAANTTEDLRLLRVALDALPIAAPITVDERASRHGSRVRAFGAATASETELIALTDAVGRICACEAGLYPPCLPVVVRGELIMPESVEALKAANTFGLSSDKRIAVIKEY